MGCCNEITDLGCFTHCGDEYLLPINSDEPGVWRFELNFSGSVKRITAEFDATEKLAIPGPLNENYTYTFKVFRPDGSQFGTGCYAITIKPLV